MTFRSARLSADHRTSAFDCGIASLNEWLTGQALRAEQAGICATTVWTEGDRPNVVAYYSIAPTLLSRQALPSRSFAGGYSSIPGYLVGRLALDRTRHGNRLGSQLLLDALETAVLAAERGGGRIIVVDAIDDDAVRFCEHHDFVRCGQTTRLVMKIATARAAIA